MDRLLTWEGGIRRRQRQNYERFLHHENERIRNYACAVAARLEQERAQHTEDWLVEEEEGWSAEVEDITDAEDLSDCAENDRLDRKGCPLRTKSKAGLFRRAKPGKPPAGQAQRPLVHNGTMLLEELPYSITATTAHLAKNDRALREDKSSGNCDGTWTCAEVPSLP